MRAPRVLLVDDDERITAMLRRGFSFEGFDVMTLADGLDVERAARQYQPDIVVMDVLMPRLDGLGALRRLRRDGLGVPVLLLTARDAPSDQVSGLEAGADDYVVKPFRFEVLLARVRALLRRARPEPTAAPLRFADLSVNEARFEVTRGARQVTLTPRELRVLLVLLETPGRVYSKQDIMDRVWGGESELDENTVEAYVKLLRQKLEGGGERRLIHTIRGVGYVLRE